MSNETGPAGEPRSAPNIQPGCDEQRRRFVVISTTGALGILLSFRLGSDRAAVLSEQRPFDAWVEISPDARVVLRIAKAEMGQGVLTSLAQLLAEELDVDWKSVEVQQAPINPTRYDHLTVGSDSVRSLWMPLRRAGALARDLLTRAAAEQWNASAAECRTESGTVIGPQGQRVSYGQVAKQAAALAPAAEPRIKRVNEF